MTAYEVAAATPDPELPLLTVADLGILRAVEVTAAGVIATITPTYSGCPALREIGADVRRRLERAGFAPVTVRTRLAPAWTSDWITAEGRRKLAAAGIAPPSAAPRRGGPVPLTLTPGPPDSPDCPRCGSNRTRQTARFGSTACKSLHRCEACDEPFEMVKPFLWKHCYGSTVMESTVMESTAFHPLVVERVDPLTEDSAAITFAVPGELAGAFAFAPGQSLTIRRGQQRRSYSICSPAGAAPRIGVREVARGAVSGWLVHQVKPGDIVEAQVPRGTFTPDLAAAADHVLIAAGSGITPMMSIAASVLAANAASTVTLLYGNRRSGTVMFVDEVADLKDAYPARMRIVHVLSREPQEVELHSGRLDRDRLARLLPATVNVNGVHHWWLCGPFGLVTDAMEVLADLGVDASLVHRELFYVGDEPPAQAAHDDDPAHNDVPAGDGATVTVVLDGRSSTFALPAGSSVLDGAQTVRSDLPFACKGGVCGTCRARVTSGAAEMRRNYALESHEVAAGYVLTCQARPRSDVITVDYDA